MVKFAKKCPTCDDELRVLTSTTRGVRHNILAVYFGCMECSYVCEALYELFQVDETIANTPEELLEPPLND